LLARVLHVEADRASCWVAGQVVVHPAGEGWRAGDWVDLESRQVLGQTQGDFPHREGDFLRLAEDDGKRWRALHQRAALYTAIRRFFGRRGFLEVDPPAMATSPGLELHLDAIGVDVRTGMGGPPTRRWLCTSPEYFCKRLLSAGVGRMYALGHAFRSGERGPWHNPEFTLLEWYRAGAGWRKIVIDIRQLVRETARALGVAPPPTPWPVWSVRQAVQRFAGVDVGRTPDPDQVAELLVSHVEPALRRFPAVVLAPWPASMASLARTVPGRPHLAERFEVYLHGIEIANGFGELTDASEQRRRFEGDLSARRQTGRPLYPIDERFLLALREGVPPSSGVALGVDRLLMVLGGYREIGDVLAFPFERA
jgi:lysyl-tRNA synthetase class 2